MPKASSSPSSTSGFATRHPVAGVVLSLALIASGCGPEEPKVATGLPPGKSAPPVDLKAPLPKGMPKNTTAGLKVDPTTGRPIQE